MAKLKAKSKIKIEQANQLSSAVRSLLEENVGNKLTPALATGILTMFNSNLLSVTEQPKAENKQGV